MTILMLIFLVFLHFSAVCTVYHNGTKVFLKSNLDFHTLIFHFTRQLVSMLSIFPNKFRQIHITSVSGYIKVFILKICQTVAGISMIGKFHDFFQQGNKYLDSTSKQVLTPLCIGYSMGIPGQICNMQQQQDE